VARWPTPTGPGAACWAFPNSPAREFYDAKIAAGKGHHAALRALGNRWLAILWHCLHRGVRYDEAIHKANRTRNLKQAA
jgi:hypothetical protein